MKNNPLAVFTGLALAALAAVAVVEKDKWMGPPSASLAKIEPAPATAPPKVEEPAKVEEVAKVAEPAKVEEVAKVAEPAKVETPAEVKKPNPSFDTVRVEASGSTIVAGQADPGSDVTVKYNGTDIGTTTANADGAFVITPEKPLPKGAGALSIEMKSQGIVVASAETVAVDVKEGAESTPLVAVLNPDQPTAVVQVPSAAKPALPAMDTVNLDSVDYDEKGNIVFSGRGPSGSKVQVYVDNNAYGLAAVGPDGTWTMPGGVPLTIGAHELRADEIGTDGKVTSRVAMPFFREDPSKVAKAIPAPTVVAVAEPGPVVATTEEKTATAVGVAPITPVAPADPAKAPEVAAAAPAPAAPVAEAAPAVVTAPEPAPAVVAAPEPAPAVAAATPPVVEPPKVEVAPAPEPAPAPAVVAEAKPPTQIVIQPGNNLWKLSRKIYGKGMMYTVIYEANKGQIRKPGLIYPGQVFLTPDAAKTP